MSHVLNASDRDLTTRARRAGRHVALGQLGGAILSLLSMAALARLLSPGDFGLVAMVTVVTAFVMNFADAGLTAAVVLHDRLDQRQVSNLFWFNVTLGVLLFFGTVASAPLLAAFYDRPEVAPICIGCACSFLPMSLGIQHAALLRRRLEFGRLTIVGQASVAGGLVVAVAAAWTGWGPWSLVAQLNAMAILRTLLSWIACPWRPSMPSRGTGSRHLLRFGGISLADEIVRYAGRNFDIAVIGRVIGADALGVYTRAQTLFAQVPTQLSGPFNSIAGPALARVQADPGRFRSAYRSGLLMISSVALPAVAAMFVLAEPLIDFLMGPQWSRCIPVFRWLVADAVVAAVGGCAVGWLYIYGRRIRMQFVGSALPAVARAMTALLSVPLGLEACTAAISGVTLAATVASLFLALPGSPVRLRDVGAALAMPSVASFLAGCLLHWGCTSLPVDWPSGMRLLAGGAVFSIAYAIPWCLFGWGRDQLRRLLRTAIHPTTVERIVNRMSPRAAILLRRWLEKDPPDQAGVFAENSCPLGEQGRSSKP
jgi:O-antigen/teichoic acid export membrane protein